MGSQVSERIERFLAAAPRGGPVLISAVGTGMFLVTLVNFIRETEATGVQVLQVLAVLISVWLSAMVVYAGFRLAVSDFSARQRWQITGSTLAGLLFVYLVMHFTLVVRLPLEAETGHPVLPLLASAHAGALAGFVIGWLFVTARQDAREAERIGEQLEFMHSILRHDVLNSMTVVRARAEYLRDRVDGYDDSVDAIHNQAEKVIDLSQRARATVNALADEDDSAEVIDLARVVDDQADTVRGTYEDASVGVDVPGTAMVEADDMLAAVVGNLLGNAVQHNDADKPRVSAAVSVDRGTVTLRVADNGPGIPDDEKAAIFERGHSSSGGGFGLFFVKTMIDHYGGDVRVEDNDPEGAVFVVELPRADPESASEFVFGRKPA